MNWKERPSKRSGPLRSPAEMPDRWPAARIEWAAAPERRLVQRPDRRGQQRRPRSAAQSGGGWSKLFLRQGTRDPQRLPDRRTIQIGGFLRFLPTLNNPWNLAAARRRAAPNGNNW